MSSSLCEFFSLARFDHPTTSFRAPLHIQLWPCTSPFSGRIGAGVQNTALTFLGRGAVVAKVTLHAPSSHGDRFKLGSGAPSISSSRFFEPSIPLVRFGWDCPRREGSHGIHLSPIRSQREQTEPGGKLARLHFTFEALQA